MKRSGKFYRKNEAEIMKMFGLKPTKNSGSGWIEKEDGQSEHVICQLKSTDASSIKINKKDLDTLQYNAAVSHKLPVFAIQFLQSQETYLVISPEALEDISRYIKTGTYNNPNELIEINLDEHEDTTVNIKKQVKSSYNAREEFRKEQERKYKKGGKSAI